MDIFDQILANLELERDLGMRTVEIDRALLVPRPLAKVQPQPVVESERPGVCSAEKPMADLKRPSVSAPSFPKTVSAPPASVPAASVCDMAFFSCGALSAKGEDAMAKIFAGLRKLKPGIALSLNEERKAKVCVLLGSDALRQRIPGAPVARGARSMPDGTLAITTFSPDYIFSHFQEGSPNMIKAKTEMWNDIKSALSRF